MGFTFLDYSVACSLFYPYFIYIYGVAQKSKPLPNYQKVVLKPVNKITFICLIKLWIKHYTIIRRY